MLTVPVSWCSLVKRLSNMAFLVCRHTTAARWKICNYENSYYFRSFSVCKRAERRAISEHTAWCEIDYKIRLAYYKKYYLSLLSFQSTVHNCKNPEKMTVALISSYCSPLLIFVIFIWIKSGPKRNLLQMDETKWGATKQAMRKRK